MNAPPRVAFFPDSFHEVNGLALTARALADFAHRQGLPMLCVRGAPRTAASATGPSVALDLERSRLAIPLERDLSYDPAWPRHMGRAARLFDDFAPDVVHVTGINDMGQLGAWLAWRRGVPLVASWHTNIHEFAARRVAIWLGRCPAFARDAVTAALERAIWTATAGVYRLARAVLAPNAALVDALRMATGRPAFLMRRGIDAERFSPAKRRRRDDTFRIGYVGRLSPEKNVRAFAALDRHLRAAGVTFEIVIVGDGSERRWLARALPHARLTGVLTGEALACAYADFDVFVFPSETDTFGNVVLEALASGVPAVVTPRGGPRSVIEPGVDGVVAPGEAAMAEAVLRLMRDRDLHARMRLAARAHALRESWDAVFQHVYGVYRQVAGARGAAAPADVVRTNAGSGGTLPG